MINNIKQGYKTTEFWLSVFTIILQVFLAIKGMLSVALATKIIAAITCLYTIARAIVKFTATTKDDEIFAKFEEILKNKGVIDEKQN